MSKIALNQLACLSAVGPFIELLPKQMCSTCDSIALSLLNQGYWFNSGRFRIILVFSKAVCNGCQITMFSGSGWLLLMISCFNICMLSPVFDC